MLLFGAAGISAQTRATPLPSLRSMVDVRLVLYSYVLICFAITLGHTMGLVVLEALPLHVQCMLALLEGHRFCETVVQIVMMLMLINGPAVIVNYLDYPIQVIVNCIDSSRKALAAVN